MRPIMHFLLGIYNIRFYTKTFLKMFYSRIILQKWFTDERTNPRQDCETFREFKNLVYTNTFM